MTPKSKAEAMALVAEAEAEAAEAEALAAAARARARAARLRREALDLDETVEDAAEPGRRSRTPVADVVDACQTGRDHSHPRLCRGQRIHAVETPGGHAATAAHRGVRRRGQARRHQPDLAGLQQSQGRRPAGDRQLHRRNSRTSSNSEPPISRRVVQESKAITEGTVNGAAVESMDEHSAKVLVSATSRVTNKPDAKDEPRTWRLKVTVADDGGQYKMSNVEFVP